MTKTGATNHAVRLWKCDPTTMSNPLTVVNPPASETQRRSPGVAPSRSASP